MYPLRCETGGKNVEMSSLAWPARQGHEHHSNLMKVIVVHYILLDDTSLEDANKEPVPGKGATRDGESNYWDTGSGITGRSGTFLLSVY